MTGEKTAGSDIKMMIAAKVAYLDAVGANEELTVGELIDRTISNLGGRGNLTKKLQTQLDCALELKEQIEKYHLEDCRRWIIKEVADHNSETGFYGCLIDTRDGEAVIGFRGSEAFDGNQVINDWVSADFGLLNNTETVQQHEAERFTRHIYDKYGDFYQNYNFSGHSLGGNLAGHATVTVPDGMPVGRCTSFDGPGYSDEYLAAHGAQIMKNGRYVDHFQYSVVGTLLMPIPGSDYRTVDASNPEKNYIDRHKLENVHFDNDGNVLPGEMDPCAAVVGPLSKSIEFQPLESSMWMILWMILNAGTVLSGLKDQVKSQMESLVKEVSNWRYSMSGVSLTGEYEINVGSTNTLAKSMDDISQKLNNINGNIDEIIRSLKYNSLAGSFFKSGLKNLSNKIYKDKQKASAMANAMRSCAQYSCEDDNHAAQLFEAI